MSEIEKIIRYKRSHHSNLPFLKSILQAAVAVAFMFKTMT